MPLASQAEPKLLSHMNQHSVIRVLQQYGPCSRADVTRQLGVTAPTVSKAVASLLQNGFVEEFDYKDNGIGRPAKRLRLATETAQVLGLVIDAEHCQLVVAGLDGELREESLARFATPKTYRSLINMAARRARRLIDRSGVVTLGLGISMPGLIDYRRQCGLLSPNVPITDGQSPAADLHEQLGIDCVLLQESHALCIAERHYGDKQLRGGQLFDGQPLDDFAMLDIGAGLGLGIVSGGRVLTGHSGLAGEIGHIPYDRQGRLCGCGKLGCLETMACDAALAHLVSQRIGRTISMEEVLELAASGEISAAAELEQVLPALGTALTTVINLFNPSTLFVNGRLFELDPEFFDRLLAETRQSALGPAFADCRIVRARGQKRQGAVAGIIEYLTDSLVPGMDSFLVKQN